ncbi:MAG: hypothetical protein IT462_00110 [Planctomycetes bacterium]|nr:hypothetical protein [Planctomycetota bacterium]
MIGYYPINPAGPASEDAFGPRFFKTRFYSWIRETCTTGDKTPVLEIMLTSGQVLDISHIVDLRDEYMLVSVFSDIRDCSKTYHTYVRYLTIYRINVLAEPQEDRPLGFNVKHEPLVITNGKKSPDLDEILAKRKAAEKAKAEPSAKKKK